MMEFLAGVDARRLAIVAQDLEAASAANAFPDTPI
jgi:hypothetical protein